jgi:hypothetical protein
MPKNETAESNANEGRINALRELLKNSESAAIEAAEGITSATDSAALRVQRQAWRGELDALEREQNLTDLRKAKRAEIRVACENAITGGVDAGGKHYSLTEHDQIELMAQAAALREGAAAVPYHADGELCEVMPAAAFTEMAGIATAHIFYHRTYCNHMNTWIDRATKAQLATISYGAALPEDLAAHMESIIGAAGGAA